MQERPKPPTERHILVGAYPQIDEVLTAIRAESGLRFSWYPAQHDQVEIHTKRIKDYDQLRECLNARQLRYVTRRAYRQKERFRFA